MGIGVISAGFAACNDDDDNGSNGGSTNAKEATSALKDKDGNPVQVAAVGDCAFVYGTDGQLAGFSTEDGTYAFQNNSLFFTDGKGSTGTIYMSDGLIRSIKIDQKNVKDEDETLNDRFGTINFSYNSSRQLAKVHGVVSGTISFGQNSDKMNFNSTGNATYTWENNNLVKSAYKSSYTISGVEDGQQYTESETYENTVTFAYGSQQNVTRQFPYFVADAMEIFGDYCSFASLGFFGVGSAQLPTGYTEVSKEDSEDEHNYASTLAFELNENGTLHREIYDGYKIINYTYASQLIGEEDITPAPNAAHAPMKPAQSAHDFVRLFFGK